MSQRTTTTLSGSATCSISHLETLDLLFLFVRCSVILFVTKSRPVLPLQDHSASPTDCHPQFFGVLPRPSYFRCSYNIRYCLCLVLRGHRIDSHATSVGHRTPRAHSFRAVRRRVGRCPPRGHRAVRFRRGSGIRPTTTNCSLYAIHSCLGRRRSPCCRRARRGPRGSACRLLVVRPAFATEGGTHW